MTRAAWMVLVGLLVGLPAGAQTKRQDSTLRGIGAVVVIVESLDADVERDGLTKNAIQREFPISVSGHCDCTHRSAETL